jgi:hypothetical protein
VNTDLEGLRKEAVVVYSEVLPVNTSNNLWVADFCITIYWIYVRRRLQSLITLPITLHKPATSSGSSSAQAGVNHS